MANICSLVHKWTLAFKIFFLQSVKVSSQLPKRDHCANLPCRILQDATKSDYRNSAWKQALQPNLSMLDAPSHWPHLLPLAQILVHWTTNENYLSCFRIIPHCLKSTIKGLLQQKYSHLSNIPTKSVLSTFKVTQVLKWLMTFSWPLLALIIQRT